MTLGFVGLGDMGLPMARRLLAAGHQVIVYNRSSAKADLLGSEGAEIAKTPAQVMERAELIGLCLTAEPAVEQVAFGSDGLFSASTLRAKAIADFSTSGVEPAINFAARAAEVGVNWVDAPVSGGVPAAVNGTLIVFAGGNAVGVEALVPLFSCVAKRVTHMGPSGSGQATKLCNQTIVLCNMLVIAETMAMARRAGIDVDQLVPALQGGFADSLPLQIFGPRMAAHQFEPRLGAIALMQKDANLAAGFAEKFAAQMPMLKKAIEVYSQVEDDEADLSAIIGLYESHSP